MAINMNTFANEVALAEGGKAECNVAQIKQILKVTLGKLANMSLKDLGGILEKYKNE